MTSAGRPLADRLEVGVPQLARVGARIASALPEPLRRRVLQSAFDRARDAFNRGDFEVVFALFADDVEYGPPPPLAGDEMIHGRPAVEEFWQGVFARYEANSIENLALEETSPGRFVRRARLRHRARGTGEQLDYVVVQTTTLDGGRVVRQVNALG